MNRFQADLMKSELLAVDEQLSREQFQLAEWLEENKGMDFKEAVDVVLEESSKILPGYRGIAKLTMFRNHIRNRMMEV